MGSSSEIRQYVAERGAALTRAAFLLTGNRQDADRARLAGADRMLAKPCDAGLIVDEARRLLLSRVGRALAPVEDGGEP